MELATIDISEDEARARLAEYQNMIREERTAEDEAIAAGYRAAARGLPVISLPQAVAAGGFHPNGMPRIAVVRADARRCYAYWDGSDIIFCDYDDGWSALNRGAIVGQHTVRVHFDQVPADRTVGRGSYLKAATVVPIIPPRYRPRLRRLHGFHILWEVEDWERIPPKDPALVRHIRGDLWSVHAVWDLTELERHVLSQRARADA